MYQPKLKRWLKISGHDFCQYHFWSMNCFYFFQIQRMQNIMNLAKRLWRLCKDLLWLICVCPGVCTAAGSYKNSILTLLPSERPKLHRALQSFGHSECDGVKKCISSSSSSLDFISYITKTKTYTIMVIGFVYVKHTQNQKDTLFECPYFYHLNL